MNDESGISSKTASHYYTSDKNKTLKLMSYIQCHNKIADIRLHLTHISWRTLYYCCKVGDTSQLRIISIDVNVESHLVTRQHILVIICTRLRNQIKDLAWKKNVFQVLIMVRVKGLGKGLNFRFRLGLVSWQLFLF